ARKDRVVHDLVQQHREIEDRKALDEGEGNPDQRILVPDQPPRGERKNAELADRDREVPQWLLLMQIAHLIARNRRAELGPQPSRMLRVMVRFHGGSIVTGSGIKPHALGRLTAQDGSRLAPETVTVTVPGPERGLSHFRSANCPHMGTSVTVTVSDPR